MRTAVFLVYVLAVCAGAAAPLAQPFGFAQGGSQTTKITADDYARAEKMLAGNVTPLVYRSGLRANWLPDVPSKGSASSRATSSDERFWYRVTTENGGEAVLVDSAKGTTRRRLLMSRSRVSGSTQIKGSSFA